MQRFKWWFGFKQTVCMKIAWLLPKTVVMWCFYRVLADDPDPESGLRLVKPIDVIDRWARHHGLYKTKD